MPAQEEAGLLMSSVCKKNVVLAGIGTKKRKVGGGVIMGQLALIKGLARMGIRYHGQGANIPSKGFSFPTKNMCRKYLNNMYPCVLDKKRFLCAG